MRSANATNVHRKSGVAKWRDLLFLFRFSRTQGPTKSRALIQSIRAVIREIRAFGSGHRNYVAGSQ